MYQLIRLRSARQTAKCTSLPLTRSAKNSPFKDLFCEEWLEEQDTCLPGDIPDYVRYRAKIVDYDYFRFNQMDLTSNDV